MNQQSARHYVVDILLLRVQETFRQERTDLDLSGFGGTVVSALPVII